MQIFHKGTPTKDVPIKLTCLDAIMVDMLSCAPDEHAVYLNSETLRNLSYVGIKKPIYKFITGAELYCDLNKNDFLIYHNVVNGNAAVAELKLLDCLRLAKKHYNDMKLNNCDRNLILPSLRITKMPLIPLSNGFNNI